MPSIQCVSAKVTTPESANDLAVSSGNTQPEDKFGAVMDRTLARSQQRPAGEESSFAHKAAKKANCSATDEITADADDQDGESTDKTDDSKTVAKSQDTDTTPLAMLGVYPMLPFILPVIVAETPETAGGTETPTDGTEASAPINPQSTAANLLTASPAQPEGSEVTPETATSKTEQAGGESTAFTTVPMGETVGSAETGNKKPTPALAATNPEPSRSTDLPIKAEESNSSTASAEVAIAGIAQSEQNENSNENGPISKENSGGIYAAQLDVQMKKTDKKNKFAGATSKTEKVLPENAGNAVFWENLPTGDKNAQIIPFPVERISTASGATHFTSQERPIEVASASTGSMAPVSAVIDLRMRALDRTAEIMALQSTRLSEMTTDNLKVTIRPGAGVELAVELHHGEKGIEATATLRSGDYHFLNSNWPDLQQRLEAKGVRLAPLTTSEQFSDKNNNQFQQPRRQDGQPDDPMYAGAFADFVMAGTIARQATRTIPLSGFESWA